MAKAISDEELQLKKRARRRLVGAIALVLLVVVFLPMFLDSEPRPLNQDIAINIPQIPNPETTPPPSGPPPVAGMPQQAAPPPAPEAAPPPAPAAAAPVPKPEASAAEERPRAQPEPRAAARPAAPVPRHEAKPASGGDAYVVQLGAFSNAANARALQKKLQENRFKAYTELIKSPGGDRTRVRVGPYPTREAADKARDQLKSRKLIIGDATVVRQGD
ncbi:MAG TPA: SPOR domain-containing protein [Burkholderiales bacterium]|nr:SPOR domain-containing protein [Burkholderiales bacterium]